MAKVSASVEVPLSPQEAWEHASDLSRYREWLTIHRVWRSKLPETLDKGTVVESIVEVKGMHNRITWTIVNFRPPESMTLDGVGVGGVKVKLVGRVRPADDNSSTIKDGAAASVLSASVVSLDVHLGGPALFGPIGMIVAASLRGDIRSSLDRFVAVFAPD